VTRCPHWSHCVEFWRAGWYRRHNHPCQILCQSVQGFRSSETPNFAVLHSLSWSPLQNSVSTTVLHCDHIARYPWTQLTTSGGSCIYRHFCFFFTKNEQLVKVIWQQAASPPHMDGSVVVARWRQCAPHLIHVHASFGPVESKPQTASWSLQPFLHSALWTCSGMFFPLKLPLRMGIWTPSNNAFLGPPECITQTTSQSVQPFLHRSRQSVVEHVEIAASHGGSGPPPN